MIGKDSIRDPNKVTDCGRFFEHEWHPYRTERDKIKICDGVFRSKKVGDGR